MWGIHVPVHVPAPVVHEIHHDEGVHHEDVHLDAAMLNLGKRVAELEHLVKLRLAEPPQMPGK